MPPIRVYCPNNHHQPLLLLVIITIIMGFVVVALLPNSQNAADQFFLWFEWLILVLFLIYLPFGLYLNFVHFNKLPTIEIWKDKVVLSNSRTGSEIALTKRDVVAVERKKIIFSFIGVRIKNIQLFVKKISYADGVEDPIYAFVNFLSFKFHRIPCNYHMFFSRNDKDKRKVNHGIALVNQKEFGFHIFIPEHDYAVQQNKFLVFRKRMRNDLLLADLKRVLT